MHTQALQYLANSKDTNATTPQELRESILGYPAMLQLLKDNPEPKPVKVNKHNTGIELTFADGSKLEALKNPFAF